MSKHDHDHNHEQDTKLLREILHALNGLAHDVHRILHLLQPKPLTIAIAVRFTHNGVTMADNVLVLNVGDTSTASILPLLADGTTPSGGTLSNVAYAFSDPSATVVLNSDGLTALVTGVAASSGPITGTATCTVTDTDGVVSTWSQAFTITTNGVTPPAQLTQSVAVQFTTPTPGTGGGTVTSAFRPAPKTAAQSADAIAASLGHASSTKA